MLDVERAFYEEHAKEWEAEHRGSFVVVKDAELIGAYQDFNTALVAGSQAFGLSNFLVRQVGQDHQKVSIPALTLGLLNANH